MFKPPRIPAPDAPTALKWEAEERAQNEREAMSFGLSPKQRGESRWPEKERWERERELMYEERDANEENLDRYA